MSLDWSAIPSGHVPPDDQVLGNRLQKHGSQLKREKTKRIVASETVICTLHRLVEVSIQARSADMIGEMNRYKAADPFVYGIVSVTRPYVTRDGIAVVNRPLRVEHNRGGRTRCWTCAPPTWRSSS